MVWTALPTFTAGQPVTAAQLAALVADLMETAPAKATGSGTFFVGSGVNSITERRVTQAFEPGSDTTTSSAFGDLTGGGFPATTATTGTLALLFLAASMHCNTANGMTAMSLNVSGATTVTAGDGAALRHTSAVVNANMTASIALPYSLTAGSNTFTAQYRVTVGTGTFGSRRVVVFPF